MAVVYHFHRVSVLLIAEMYDRTVSGGHYHPPAALDQPLRCCSMWKSYDEIAAETRGWADFRQPGTSTPGEPSHVIRARVYLWRCLAAAPAGANNHLPITTQEITKTIGKTTATPLIWS